MTLVATGDRQAFAALYQRRRGDVFRFALHVSGSSSVADDVTQDVFMAVIHGAGRYRSGRSTARAWLLGVARNFVRRARSARQADELPDEDSLHARAIAIDADAVPRIERLEHVARVRRAVLTLPVKYREAIVLCDLQELSYAEAAAVARVRIGTMRSRLHRGRALLARRLRGEDEACVRPRVVRSIV